MESNDRGKRKGLAKGKLVMMSIYRATSKHKQPLASSSTSSSKAKPSQGGNLHHHHHLLSTTGQAKQRVQPSSDYVSVNQSQRLAYALIPPPSMSISTTTAGSSVEFIVNQEKVTPSQPKQGVSILLQETSSRDTHANVDSFYATVAADEGVDIKAATYISSVRERFRLQPMNSV